MKRVRGVPPLQARGKRSEEQRRADELAAQAHQEQAARMLARGRHADTARKGRGK